MSEARRKSNSSVSSVGDITHSVLSETQFQALRGLDWVLCDGRSVAGSKLADEFGFANVPDARGQFLRGKNNGRADGQENPDGEVGLGTQQTDEINSHGHAFPWGSTAGSSGKMGSSFQHNGTTPFPNANQVAVTGGNETRPKNITVNIFIKIN